MITTQMSGQRLDCATRSATSTVSGPSLCALVAALLAALSISAPILRAQTALDSATELISREWTVLLQPAEDETISREWVVMPQSSPDEGIGREFSIDMQPSADEVIAREFSIATPAAPEGFSREFVVFNNPVAIADTPDATICFGSAYTGPTPTFRRGGGRGPFTWTLEVGPEGMTINAQTGVVNWPEIKLQGSPHTITIRATNANGDSDDETWRLCVAASTEPKQDPFSSSAEAFARSVPGTLPEQLQTFNLAPPPFQPGGWYIANRHNDVHWASSFTCGTRTVTAGAADSFAAPSEATSPSMALSNAFNGQTIDFDAMPTWVLSDPRQQEPIQGGNVDRFAFPRDAASPSTALRAALMTNGVDRCLDFDLVPGLPDEDGNKTRHDRMIAHTFTSLPMGRIVGAQLEIYAKPGQGTTCSDKIRLGMTTNPSVLDVRFAYFIGTSPATGLCGGQDPGWLPREWNQTEYPDGAPIVLDLSNLPWWTGAGGSAIADMNTEGRLDVIVSDDTGVDYKKLTLWVRVPVPITQYVAHTFTGLPSTLASATLQLQVRAGDNANGQLADWLALGFAADGAFSPAWLRYLGSGNPQDGLFSQPWTPGADRTIDLNLAALPLSPQSGGGALDLLKVIKTQGLQALDVVVGTSTAVDYMTLTYTEADPLTMPYVDSTDFITGADEVTRDNCDSAWYRWTFEMPQCFENATIAGLANVDDVGVVYLNGHLLSAPLIDTDEYGTDRAAGGHPLLSAPTPDAFAAVDDQHSLFQPFTNELVFGVLRKGNSPTGVEFTATISYLRPLETPGDFDWDGDVDMDDLDTFQSCYSGPTVSYTGDCAKANFDGDGDVDQTDFGVFQRCFSGANCPAGPGRAD